MKTDKLMEMVLSGKTVTVGLYWSGKLEEFDARDKKTGQARHYKVARETVLTETDPVTVTRFLKDDERADVWKPAAKKNQKVVVLTTGLTNQNGTVTIQGTIEPLE
jgi:hypothetical protein